MSIGDFVQGNFKECVIYYLDSNNGEAYSDGTMEYWRSVFLREGTFSLEEFHQCDPSGTNCWKHGFHAAVEQLRKDGFLEEADPRNRGLWVRTQKPWMD